MEQVFFTVSEGGGQVGPDKQGLSLCFCYLMLPMQKQDPGKDEKERRSSESQGGLKTTQRESAQQTVTYNCQMLDFFFSARVGFSLEALKEKTRPRQGFHLVSLASVALVLI